jgi:hypothetical protein
MSVKAFIGVEFHTEAQAQAFFDGISSGDDRRDPLLAAERAIRGLLGDVAEGEDADGQRFADPIYLDVYAGDVLAAVDTFRMRPTTATDRGTIVIEPGEGL